MKKSLALALCALWILSLVVTYFLGNSNATNVTPETGAINAGDSEPDVQIVKVREREVIFTGEPGSDTGAINNSAANTARFSGSTDSANGGEAKIYSLSEIETLFPKMLNSRDRITQNLEVARMLAQVTPENASAMLKAFEKTNRNWLTDQHFRMFMHAWGKVDGPAAVAYGYQNNEGREVSFRGDSAMSAWAEQDPDAAMAYMEQQDKGMFDRMHGGYMYGLSRADPAGAQRYVGDMEPGRMRDGSVDIVIRNLAENGPRGLLDWSTTVLNDEDKGYARRVVERAALAAARDDGIQLAGWLDRHGESEYVNSKMFEEAADEWAESNPRAAASWLEGHMDDPRVNSEVIAELSEEWGKTDPASAAVWVEKHLEDERVNDRVIGELSSEWARKDPAAAIEWVNQFVDDMDGGAIARTSGAIAGQDPEAALDWVASLPENKQRESFDRIGREWPNEQLPAAVEWLAKEGEGAQYDGAREAVSWRLTDDDPAEAIRVASTIEDERRRERTLVGSARALNRQNPEAVTAWLPVSGLSAESQARVTSTDRGRGDWGRGRDRGR